MRGRPKMAANVLRIGDGVALTRKLSYYKLISPRSKMVKLGDCSALLPIRC